MQLPQDYAERVYAGVLGKIIGVYLGRPFEGWEYERIERELGEITDYVHERFGVPLIVTDDDISGTFTFIRALEDFAGGADVSAADIGRTWLNYLIEERTVLWWGGLGKLHRAHRLPASQERRGGAAQRLNRPQHQGGGGADRRPDLHRRLGHGGAGAIRNWRPRWLARPVA